MAHIFISYSRRDKVFVQQLTSALKSVNRDYWLDENDIPPSAEWLKEVKDNIELADNFIFVISPDSVASPVCQEEVAHALQYKKRIIPIVCHDVSPRDIEAKEKLAPLIWLNWVYFRRESDNLNASFQKLLFALDTDLDYWHKAARYLVRARQWESGQRNASFVLRGKELVEAERWLAEGANKQPNPTALHTQYITASRRAANTRQRTTIGGLSAGLIVTLVLSIISTLLYGTTQQQNQDLANKSRVLFSQVLAGEANGALVNNELDQALLLSIEGYQHNDNFLTRNALLNALEYSPYLEAVLQSHATSQQENFDGLAVAFLDNGRTLMSAKGDNQLTFWDVATRHQRRVITTQHLLTGAVPSPNGQVVATEGIGTGLVLWDITTGNMVVQLGNRGLDIPQRLPNGVHPTNTNLHNMAFSPDGNTLAIWDCADNQCTRGQIDLWNVPSRTIAGSLLLDSDPFSVILAFSPDGRYLASSSNPCISSCKVVLWNVSSMKRIATYAVPGGSSIYDLAFTPDSKALAAGGCSASCTQGQVFFWDVTSGRQLNASPLIQSSRNDVYTLAFSTDGQTLITGSSTGELRLWDMATMTAKDAPLPAHTNGIRDIAVSADGRHFASIGGRDDKVLLWRMSPFTPGSLPLRSGLDGNSQAVFSSDGKMLATGNCQGQILFWDVATGQPLNTWNTPNSPNDCVNSLAFSSDGRLLGEGMLSGNVFVWDAKTGQVLKSTRPTVPNSGFLGVTKLVFSPDGRFIAFSTLGNAYLGDLNTNSIEQFQYNTTTLDPAPFSPEAAFSPDGHLLAVGTDDSSITLWDLQAHRLDRKLVGEHVIATGVAFSPDGQTLAAIGSNAELVLWDMKTYTVAHRYQLPQASKSAEYDLLFSPNGKMLIAYQDKSITLWDVQKHELITRPLLEPDAVSNVSISSDGRLFATAEVNGPVIVRYATVDLWRAQACSIAQRNFTLSEWSQFFTPETYQKTCPDFPVPASPRAVAATLSGGPAYMAHVPGLNCDSGPPVWNWLTPDTSTIACQPDGLHFTVNTNTYGLMRFSPVGAPYSGKYHASVKVNLSTAPDGCGGFQIQLSNQSVYLFVVCLQGAWEVFSYKTGDTSITVNATGHVSPTSIYAVQLASDGASRHFSINGHEVSSVLVPTNTSTVLIALVGLINPNLQNNRETAIFSDFVYTPLSPD